MVWSLIVVPGGGEGASKKEVGSERLTEISANFLF